MSMTCVEFYSWSGQTRVQTLIYSLIWYWLNAAVLPHITSKEFLILYKGKFLLLIQLLDPKWHEGRYFYLLVILDPILSAEFLSKISKLFWRGKLTSIWLI